MPGVKIVALQRLIPAGAGRTTRRCASGCPCSAHPRWRGEDTIIRMEGTAEFGSSPLARGGPRRQLD